MIDLLIGEDPRENHFTDEQETKNVLEKIEKLLFPHEYSMKLSANGILVLNRKANQTMHEKK
ncbi:hypothetical protein KA405_05465 [Patescibacteria group bacterium]|nr:hypothetical protein [Patescibacteria group bacterium]